MEEKKKRNINIIAILLIVAVVVNVAMSGYICFDKVNDNKVVAEYEANASDLQKEIDELQKANISDDTDDENISQEDPDEHEKQIEQLYDRISDLQEQVDLIYNEDQDIIDTIATILFYRGANATMKAWSAESFPYVPWAEPSVSITIDGLGYEKMAVPYSDMVEKYSMIFTGNALDEFLSIRFADVDGDLYVLHGGMSGWSIGSAELTRVSESNGEIKYSVSFASNFGSVEFPSIEKDTCNMTIKSIDGSYRISEFDYYKN